MGPSMARALSFHRRERLTPPAQSQRCSAKIFDASCLFYQSPRHDVDGSLPHAQRTEDDSREQPESGGGGFSYDQAEKERLGAHVQARSAETDDERFAQPADEDAQPQVRAGECADHQKSDRMQRPP